MRSTILPLCLLAACTRADQGARPEPAPLPAASEVPQTPPPPPAIESRPTAVEAQSAGPYDATAELRRIAGAYKSSLTEVTGVPSWALGDCALPPQRVLPFDDGDTHADAGLARAVGQKLYYLYARDTASYFPGHAERGPADQVVVKESWTVRDALPSELGPPGPRSSGFDDARMREVWEPRDKARGTDGGVVRKVIAVDRPAGLFVIWRAPEGATRTDAGWLYGTVAPDGTVTSAGVVAACSKCHGKADRGGGERLFGPSLN